MGWYERFTAGLERHRLGVDLGGAAVWALASLALVTAFGGTPDASPTASMLWTLALIAPLPWRRVYPGPSALTIYLVMFAHLFAGILIVFPADASVMVALYSVTAYGPRWAHKAAISAALTAGAFIGLAEASQESASGAQLGMTMGYITTFLAMVCLVVWAFGLTRRARIEALKALRDRAEQLEVERDQHAQLAAANERTRIAREMHDIVAHSLSVMIAQADGGRYAATVDPPAAVSALVTVAETGRAALADMRRLLGVLRSDDSSDEQSSLVPQPDGREIAGLVAEARASGLRISFVRTGTPRGLPPGASLTVYRVCQESLTNILKHAGPDPAVTLALHWEPDALVVEVADNGRGAAADEGSPGFGLVGMNERAALFGGTVTAGPRPGGGFQVRFRMPLPRA